MTPLALYLNDGKCTEWHLLSLVKTIQLRNTIWRANVYSHHSTVINKNTKTDCAALRVSLKNYTVINLTYMVHVHGTSITCLSYDKK